MKTAYLLTMMVFLAACSSSKQSEGFAVPEVHHNPGDPVATHVAQMETSLGAITIELYGNDAPLTVANFVGLADSGYFNGILFHRVAQGFVIQGGDPLTKDPTRANEWGSGGRSIYGPTFADELNPSTPSYKRGYVKGTLAMANRGPNTNSSQFFIMLDDAPGLPKLYTIFGQVIAGMDVVAKIENTELVNVTQMGGRPKVPVAIGKILVRKL
jgi:cyclophilin family peptidyl-prolyl cis-trans isomerase